MTTYNKLVPNTVSFQGLNPLTFLERSAYVYPRKTAVVYGERHFTYQEFHQRVVKLSAALKQVGVAKGDRVAFLVPNLPEMLEGHFGPLRVGAILVALNIRLSSREIEFIINHSGAKVLVFERISRSSRTPPGAERLYAPDRLRLVPCPKTIPSKPTLTYSDLRPGVTL